MMFECGSPEDNAQFGGKGADQVDGALAARCRPANRFSINGQRAAQGADDAADPAAKGRLERLWIEQAEDAQEGVLRRDAVLEHQKPAQPAFLGKCPASDVFDRIAIREHGRDRDHQDLLKVVQGSVARFARIIDFAQTVHQTYSLLLRRHFVRPKDESRLDFLSVYNELL